MLVLALDTALGACSVAIGDAQGISACRFEAMGTGHAEALMPMIEAVLAEARVAPGQLDRLGVTIGPGSFTGTRIGLAAARAFGRALGIPVIGVTTFEALAVRMPGRPRVVAFDARRGQIYVQFFAADGTPRNDGAALEATDAARHLEEWGVRDPVLLGSGAAMLGEMTGAEISEYVWPDASAFLPLIARAPMPKDMPRPLYLRAPDVTVPATP